MEYTQQVINLKKMGWIQAYLIKIIYVHEQEYSKKHLEEYHLF